MAKTWSKGLQGSTWSGPTTSPPSLPGPALPGFLCGSHTGPRCSPDVLHPEASPWLFPLPEMPFLQTPACLASFKSLPHLTFSGRPAQSPCLILPSAHPPPQPCAPYPPLRMDSFGQSTDCSPHVYDLPVYPACCRFPREAEDLRVFCSLAASRAPRTVPFILRRICV